MLSDILKKRAECREQEKRDYLARESDDDHVDYLKYESEFDDFISSSWTDNQNVILIEFIYPLTENDSEITWMLLTEFRGRSILARVQFYNDESKPLEELQLNLRGNFSKYYFRLFETLSSSINPENIVFHCEIATIWHKFNDSPLQKASCFFYEMNPAESTLHEAVKYLCYSSRLRFLFDNFFSRFITG